MVSGVAATAAPSPTPGLFLPLLKALTEIGLPELPSQVPASKNDSPIGKEGKKNKPKEDPKVDLQGNLTFTLLIDTPPPALRKAPIIIEPIQSISATAGPGGPSPVQPAAQAAFPGAASVLNGQQPQPAFAPLSQEAPTLTVPLDTHVAFTARLTPVDNRTPVPDAQSLEPVATLIGIAPGSAPEPAQRPAREPAPGPAPATSRGQFQTAAPHENGIRIPELIESTVPAARTPAVHDQPPQRLLVDTPSKQASAGVAQEDTPVHSQSVGVAPKNSAIQLQPVGVAGKDSVVRPPPAGVQPLQNVPRGENSSHTAGDPPRRWDSPPAKQTATPEPPDASSVPTPATTFSPVSTKGNDAPAVLENRTPSAVRVEPKPEISSGLQAPSTREISLRVSDADAAKVDVRLTERAGKVHVAVRTDDRELSKSLQSDLGELVGRLERKGYNTETWTPGERLGSSSARDTADNRDGGSSPGWTQQQQQQGQGDPHRRQRMQWETETGQNFQIAEGQSESNDDQSN